MTKQQAYFKQDTFLRDLKMVLKPKIFKLVQQYCVKSNIAAQYGWEVLQKKQILKYIKHLIDEEL